MVHLLLATVFYLFGKLKPCCRFPLVFYEEKRFLLKNNPINARKEEEMLVSNLNRRLWLIISIMQRMNWKQFAVQIFFFGFQQTFGYTSAFAVRGKLTWHKE